MNQRTVNIKSGLRLASVAALAILLGGCSTYYQSYYPDSGVYYEDSGVYGHASGYSRGGYGRVNPVDYPYWSIDYFYFSQYYHPYSVYVGYHEPLYYPYPGWALGHYRPIGWHGSLAFGFGYPWYGYGYRYPAYTFGFFSGYDPYYHRGYYGHDRRDRHRIRHIDRRLEALQHGNSYASRRELLGRDRVAGRVDGSFYDRRGGSRSAARPQSPVRSRADVMRQRSVDNSRAVQRRTLAPGRNVERRTPNVRSERRALDRDRIRRDGVSSANEGHRGIPIEALRGRTIVDSRNRRAGDARDADRVNRERAAAHRNIRRAPAVDWNRSPSRQDPGRASRRADAGARSGLLNQSSRNLGPQTQRPARSAPPPSRPARSIGSRPEPASGASSPSRRSVMRQKSGGRDGGGGRRDHRRDKR